MKQFALALDLKNDPHLIAEYEAHHQAVWPEILESIKASGILECRIYRVIEAGVAHLLLGDERSDRIF